MIQDKIKAVLIRALRTAIIIALPYVPTVIADGNYLIVLSAAGFGALVSILTNLFSVLPETTDGVTAWYWVIIERVVKTAAQALLTAFGTATLFQEVDWTQVGPMVATAVLGSLFVAVLGTLPGSQIPEATQVATITAGDPPSIVIDNAAPVADSGTLASDLVSGSDAESSK